MSFFDFNHFINMHNNDSYDSHDAHDHGFTDTHPVAIWDGHGDHPTIIDNHGMLHDFSSDFEYGHEGNFDTIMHHIDPLAHAHDYHCHHFELTHDHPINPHLIHIDGYFRHDGTYVNGHVRTMPDGIEENNISYHKV